MLEAQHEVLEQKEDRKTIIKKKIEPSELVFKIDITDYNDFEEDEDGDKDYAFKYVELKDNILLDKEDRENLNKELKIHYDEIVNYFSEESLITKRIYMYYKEEYIGEITCHLSYKIKNSNTFLLATECESGCSGVVAYDIVSNGLFDKMVRKRKYAYIEWINLEDEFKTIENEGIALRKLLDFLHLNYKFKRVFARPVAIDLTEDEAKLMRCSYFWIEDFIYSQYGDRLAGYVESYYQDVPEKMQYLSSLPMDKYKVISEGYRDKLNAIQDVYKQNGMHLIQEPSGNGSMYIEFD